MDDRARGVHFEAAPVEPKPHAPVAPDSAAPRRRRRALWTHFHDDGIPEYLARHYWWAYLWRGGIWFFDHQPIIDTILFGNYRELLEATCERLAATAPERFLQIACVYGELTPRIARALPQSDMHVVDVAKAQLDSCERKLERDRSRGEKLAATTLLRMNAEALAYPDGSFDTVLIFFLLHELPPETRVRVLAEAARVVRPGGRLVIVEYGARTRTHLLHRFAPARWLLGRLEPFLPVFWGEDLDAGVSAAAGKSGQRAERCEQMLRFGGFYRLHSYQLAPA